MRAEDRRERAQDQEQAIFAHVLETGRLDRNAIELRVEGPQDPGHGHRRQGHGNDQLGGPPPRVGDKNRISEHKSDHPERADLDGSGQPRRVVFAHGPEHQNILRGHEKNDDQGEESHLETAKPAQ